MFEDSLAFNYNFYSVTKLCPAHCDSPGLQHTRLPCTLSPRVCLNTHPLGQWCYLTILSSIYPFSFCLQSFPALESFPMSQLFASGGQRIGASASVSPSNEYSGLIFFSIDWFDLLAIQGNDSQKSSLAPQFERNNSWVLNLLYGPTRTSVLAL